MKKIEGVYEGKMPYQRYDGISKQQFYELNEQEIEKHLEEYRGMKWQRMFDNMYNDIMEGD